MPKVESLKTLGYIAFAIATLSMNLYFSFPAEAVVQRVAHQLSQASSGKVQVRFGEASVYGLSGVEAEDVKLIVKGDDEPKSVEVDTLRARVQLLPLLMMKFKVVAEAKLGDGSLGVVVEPGEKGSFSIDMLMEDVDFAKPPVFPKLSGYLFGGQLQGSGELKWSSKIKETLGTTSIAVEHASFGPAEIKSVAVPRIDLGKMRLELKLEGGKVRIVSFKQAGGDLQTRLHATASLRTTLSSSFVDLCLEVKPEKDFLEKNGKIKAALDLASIQFRKDAEGFLHLPFKGTLGRMKPGRRLCGKASGRTKGRKR